MLDGIGLPSTGKHGQGQTQLAFPSNKTDANAPGMELLIIVFSLESI